MRKSASVLMPSVERSQTLPPSPPSPPSGPPNGTNFSRRKLTQPRPPLPACTLRVASSMNFINAKGQVWSLPFQYETWRTRRSPVLESARNHAHELAPLGSFAREIHLSGRGGKQGMVGT